MADMRIQPWQEEFIYYNGSYAHSTSIGPLLNNNKKKSIIKHSLYDHNDRVPNKSEKTITKSNASPSNTLHNFHRTNRSEYHNRITKLVFKQESAKKYKFEPENLISRSTKAIFGSHKIKKSVKQYLNRSKEEELMKSKKKIDFNFTEVNSPLNSAFKLKCYTDQNDEKKEKEMRKTIGENKKKKNFQVLRHLSIERKIYVLQKGDIQKVQEKERKYNKEDGKKRKKFKNIIQQICLTEQEHMYNRKVKMNE